MDVKEIITKYLIIANYDGLCCPGMCWCKIDDLVPCQNNFENCIPGYLQPLNKKEKEEYDFIIDPQKPEKRGIK